jgi:hypothetical protein
VSASQSMVLEPLAPLALEPPVEPVAPELVLGELLAPALLLGDVVVVSLLLLPLALPPAAWATDTLATARKAEATAALRTLIVM